MKFHKEGVYELPKVASVKEEPKSRSQDKSRIKKLQKEITEIESKIALMEKNKIRLEELLADPGFYKNRSYQTELDNYNEIKKDLSVFSTKWEESSEELESLLSGR